MSKIHLVRHGKAAAGFGAHPDPGLDDTGRAQARAVAELLQHEGPLPIYSSPLARAYETAEALAGLWEVDITIESRVAEIPSPTDDLAERAAWLSNAMQGSWEELGEQHQTWLAAIGECLREQAEDCVMFSHYVAINAAVGVATNDPRMRIFGPDNCSVTTIENTDGALSVLSLGRTADTKIN